LWLAKMRAQSITRKAAKVFADLSARRMSGSGKKPVISETGMSPVRRTHGQPGRNLFAPYYHRELPVL
jgi:hypothetical protein